MRQAHEKGQLKGVRFWLSQAKRRHHGQRQAAAGVGLGSIGNARRTKGEVYREALPTGSGKRSARP